MENRQSAICDLLSLGLPQEGLGFDTRIHQIKTEEKPTLYSTSKQHEHKITRTSTTNLPFHNLPALLPRTVVPAFAFLPDSLRGYQHSHSPVAMKIM